MHGPDLIIFIQVSFARFSPFPLKFKILFQTELKCENKILPEQWIQEMLLRAQKAQSCSRQLKACSVSRVKLEYQQVNVPQRYGIHMTRHNQESRQQTSIINTHVFCLDFQGEETRQQDLKKEMLTQELESRDQLLLRRT